MTADIKAAIERVRKAERSFEVTGFVLVSYADHRALLAHVDTLRKQRATWQAENAALNTRAANLEAASIASGNALYEARTHVADLEARLAEAVKVMEPFACHCADSEVGCGEDSRHYEYGGRSKANCNRYRARAFVEKEKNRG